jgi:hypothetical protein
MYRIIATQQIRRPRASSYELAAAIPQKLIHHTLEIKTPDGQTHQITNYISCPQAPSISPNVPEAESAVIPFCKKFGLYQFDHIGSERSKISTITDEPARTSALEKLEAKEAHITKAILETGFGWLVGMVAPDLTTPEIIDITLYFLALFDHDDDADRAMSGGMDVIEAKAISSAMMSAYQGDLDGIPENLRNHKRVQALLELHERYFKQFQTHEDKDIREEFDYSVYTLRDYLNSVESERMHEAAEKPIDIAKYRLLRGHTGGIHHAISVICLAYGVNFAKLRSQSIEFQYMIESIAKAVGILNDYYSSQTELKELYKHLQRKGDDPTDEVIVKSQIQSNLLLMHWRDGLSIEAATKATVDEYTEQMNTFYACKNSILVKIRQNPELRKGTFACEGWLFGHGPWGAFSGRYNRTSELRGSTEDVHQKIIAAASCVRFG